jgi:hypothetical protein
MRKFFMMSYVKPLAILCAVSLLSSCAAMGKKTESIEERVNGRWAALFANEIERAYGYLTPGYRSSVSLQQYQRSIENRKMKWTSADYIKSNCDENTCVVQVKVGFTLYGALPGVKAMNSSQYAHETWILVDGTWYMVPPQ